MHGSEEIEGISSGDARKYHEDPEHVVGDRFESRCLRESGDGVSGEGFGCGVAGENKIGVFDGYFRGHIPGIGKIADINNDESDDEHFEIVEQE